MAANGEGGSIGNYIKVDIEVFLNLALANYSPWAKFSLPPGFINSYVHSFMYCLPLLLHHKNRVE